MEINRLHRKVAIIESIIRNAGSLIFLPLFSIMEATAKTRTIEKTKKPTAFRSVIPILPFPAIPVMILRTRLMSL